MDRAFESAQKSRIGQCARLGSADCLSGKGRGCHSHAGIDSLLHVRYNDDDDGAWFTYALLPLSC